ncbi:hypothetical protein [Vibrio hangzhouensis]|uniref:Uncharacterized protein n=1 Tax=Vibrio hangzhouensis TaxID=462991 RepID=A0A1H6CJD2_9VIBR|nr:hypothetical protein [Vibrio hangzhouensis]SEG73094.1 hypothetical protein SAMN04488244_1428 [Vibrio hangzhouensis]
MGLRKPTADSVPTNTTTPSQGQKQWKSLEWLLQSQSLILKSAYMYCQVDNKAIFVTLRLLLQ